ncbi:MAG: hypothetical protein ACI4JF_06375, partial [Oscillospiraceae bacterium]
LFLAAPNNSELLELELISNNIKDSIVYIKTHIDYAALNHNKFGKALMRLIKPIYESMDINVFGSKMYALWEGLAGNLQDEEPFLTLCYADDSLSHGDERTTRQKYEKMLSFYEN